MGWGCEVWLLGGLKRRPGWKRGRGRRGRFGGEGSCGGWAVGCAVFGAAAMRRVRRGFGTRGGERIGERNERERIESGTEILWTE